ncbi:hypothetical protein E1301_Tti015785 [Triplophysa tibetana]|uniref:Uncharacterized protein n=1 Tax=Triplophysa tibetana TaxID=1572043 RepID=A0A5A9NYA4_9TELE|nr:hypothetical protein E1301_Tti015785 [Triplophysa tibetana]
MAPSLACTPSRNFQPSSSKSYWSRPPLPNPAGPTQLSQILLVPPIPPKSPLVPPSSPKSLLVPPSSSKSPLVQASSCQATPPINPRRRSYPTSHSPLLYCHQPVCLPWVCWHPETPQLSLSMPVGRMSFRIFTRKLLRGLSFPYSCFFVVMVA